MRTCVECGAKITACFGFSFVGDVFCRGYLFPRELCGMCAHSGTISHKWLRILAEEDNSWSGIPGDPRDPHIWGYDLPHAIVTL